MIKTPRITHEGPTEGTTVLNLTDGSQVGFSGNQIEKVSEVIRCNGTINMIQPDGLQVLVHPEHIVTAAYTPIKGGDDETR